MCFNLTQLMSIYIISFALLPTEEPLNFYNYYAKITIKKERILLEYSQEKLNNATSLI